MSKGKQHKNMDRTSAAMTTHLDKLREKKKQAAARKKIRDRTSLSRGGFR